MRTGMVGKTSSVIVAPGEREGVLFLHKALPWTPLQTTGHRLSPNKVTDI